MMVKQGKLPIHLALLAIPRISNCSGLYLSRKVIGTPIMPLQFSLDDDSGVSFFSSNGETVSIVWVIFDVAVESNDFKLCWVIFIEEGDWHPHATITSC